MHRFVTVCVFCLITIGSLALTAQTPVEQKTTVFATLKAGQSVTVREVGGKYEISTLVDLPDVQSHKVLEVGQDHIVVEDLGGVTELHIPVYSIKSIVRLKVAPKKG